MDPKSHPILDEDLYREMPEYNSKVRTPSYIDEEAPSPKLHSFDAINSSEVIDQKELSALAEKENNRFKGIIAVLLSSV